jgi:hypothetical protein
MRTRSRFLLSAVFALLLAPGCGDDGGGGDTGDSDSSATDAGPGDRFPDASTQPPADAGPTGGGGQCTAGNYECNNCDDDDGDNLIDGADPECTGSIDDDESSFSTGIPGDNKDDKWQDCFFDGNSGAGDDGCRWHTCCALGATGGSDCPVDHNFDPDTDCPPQTRECIRKCGALTPPGCDCFGCCTVCDDVGCEDIFINPTVAPNCTQETIHNATKCPRCDKSTDCNGGECNADPDDCILCPGQTEDDLPDSCNMMNECPNGETPCDVSADCAADEYCSAGCCVNVVE